MATNEPLRLRLEINRIVSSGDDAQQAAIPVRFNHWKPTDIFPSHQSRSLDGRLIRLDGDHVLLHPHSNSHSLETLDDITTRRAARWICGNLEGRFDLRI